MRAVVALWCLVLTFCAAALFAGERRVVVDDTARSLDAGMTALDARTTVPAPMPYIGPGIAISGTTIVKTRLSSASSATRYALPRLGGASTQPLPRLRRTAPDRTTPLRI